MKNGIYGCHIEGMYCECKFQNDKLINCFVDFYDSGIELRTEIIDVKNIDFKKVK